MAAVFCSACGRSNAAGAGFCQGCGAPLAASSAPGAGLPGSAAPGAPQGWAMPGGPPMGSGLIEPTPTLQSQSADTTALGHAKTGALFGIVGLLLSLVSLAVAYSSVGFVGFGYSCSGGSCGGSAITLATALFGVDIVGLAIAIMFILKFRAAFQSLVPFDYRFKSPAGLTILAVVGLVLLLLALVLLVAGFGGLISPCSSGNSTSCTNAVNNAVGLFLGAAGLAVLGGILALIGWIMLLIGMWRLGTRYNQTLIKVGAIFLIIPFLNIVAPFLIYFGITQAQSMLAASRQMGGGGAGPFAPPRPPGS